MVQGIPCAPSCMRPDPTVSQSLVTVSRPIPYDVLCCVMEHLDVVTLKTATLVNRDFKHEADKHLWGSFRIVIDASRIAANMQRDNRIVTYGDRAREILQEGCRIVSAGIRAQRVREFTVKVERWSAIESDTTAVLETVFHTLRQLPGLRRLELDLWFTSTPDTRKLVANLTRDPFPFQLDHFAIQLWGDLEGCLHQFLCSQRNITSLHLSEDSLTDRLDEEALPLLMHLRVASAFQSIIAKNRPVTHLCVDEVLHRTAEVFSNISQSTVSFQLLWCRASWSLGTFLGTVAQPSPAAVIPHVRCLVLEYHFPLSEVPRAVFHTLALFNTVEELVWEVYTPAFSLWLDVRRRQWADVEKHFFEICSTLCVGLRKVTFSYNQYPGRGAIPIHSYRRRDFGDEWELFEDHYTSQPLGDGRHLFPDMLRYRLDSTTNPIFHT